MSTANITRRSAGRNISRSRAQVLDEPVRILSVIFLVVLILVTNKVAIEAIEDSKITDRLNVLDELLNTERDYLGDLTTVVQYYLEPMKAGKV